MPAFALGAKGFIATGPEFTDLLPSDMVPVGAGAADDTYRHAHYQLTVLYEVLMGTVTWPASFKAALNLIGLPAGVPRDPVRPMDEVPLLMPIHRRPASTIADGLGTRALNITTTAL